MKLYRTRFCILHLTKSALFDTFRKPTQPFTNSAASVFNARTNGLECIYKSISQYSSNPSGSSARAYKKRVNRRLREASKPVLDEARFNKAKSLLPPRFTADHLHDIIVQEEDPLVCYELFNWAFRQPRFRHNVNSYHITIKKLGGAQMYEELDAVVNHILAVPHIGSEALYNTMIYYYTEVRKLTRSVIVFKHMKDCRNLECRPSVKTYNLMFAAFLSRRNNTHVNHMYMETMSCLFRQMIGDGVQPDIFSLNCMIKGYVMSNHVNDGLRIFHQVEAVYKCQPNAASYDCLVHGLCAQGRTRNAKALCKEMQEKGFVLSARTYNSLVNALSLNGEVEEAVHHLREMTAKKKTADFITYRTVLDQLCREGKIREAKHLLEEVKERKAVDASSYKKLLSVLEDDFAYGRDHRSVRR